MAYQRIVRTPVRIPWNHRPSSAPGLGRLGQCANIAPALDHPPHTGGRSWMQAWLLPPRRAPPRRGPWRGPAPRPHQDRACRGDDLAGLVRPRQFPGGHGLHGHGQRQAAPWPHV